MSHHFDTPSAREDPRINICDFYIFEGSADTTVMAMTVNPDARLSAPDTFREEGLYAFRFDLNGDAHEEVTFKFRFGEARHAQDDEHVHLQSFQLLKATGEDAVRGTAGELLMEGETGKVHSQSGIHFYAGLAPDLFAGDAAALHAFMTAFYQEQRYFPEAFENRKNYFANRNVTAIVLEVPHSLIGEGLTRSWATASLYGHAPEVQVSRWGLPLITHLLLNDPGNQELKEEFNRNIPAEDLTRFSGAIAGFIEKMTAYANSADRPDEYAKQVVERLCPTILQYRLGTRAAFRPEVFNGRTLTDDAMDVMLTLAANKPLQDGVAPDKQRTRAHFPYFGEPYTRSEQANVTPAPRPAKT
jgi:hypothetical protein